MTTDYLCIILYMVSCVFFIMGIKKLGKADTARKGNLFSSIDRKIALNRALNQNLATPDRSSTMAKVRLAA